MYGCVRTTFSLFIRTATEYPTILTYNTYSVEHMFELHVRASEASVFMSTRTFEVGTMFVNSKLSCGLRLNSVARSPT